MPDASETAQEIKFWLELEAVLKNISEQLKSPEARTIAPLFPILLFKHADHTLLRMHAQYFETGETLPCYSSF